jgi:hypothetical protein
MGAARKVVAFIDIALFTVPLLVASIWAVGLTDAVLDPEFFTMVSKDVVAEVPSLMDDAVEAARMSGSEMDPEARAWAEAVGKTGTKPSELFKTIGLTAWFTDQLAPAVGGISRVLSGEVAPEAVKLDNRPLKAAMARPELRDFLAKALAGLPECTPQEMERWQQEMERVGNRHRGNAPACNPGPGTADAAVMVLTAAATEVPDEIPLFRASEFRGTEPLRVVHSLLWLIFLAPAVSLLAAALIAAGASRGFFRWFGGGAMAGALASLGLSTLVGDLAPMLMRLDPASWRCDGQGCWWTSGPGRVLAGRATDMVSMVVERLFAPVTTLGLWVLGFGALLVALSFLGGRKDDTVQPVYIPRS